LTSGTHLRPLAGACDFRPISGPATNDPEYRTGRILGGSSNENRIAARRARFCAIFFSLRHLASLFFVGPCQRPKNRAAVSLLASSLDIPGFDPLKVGVFDTAAQMAAVTIFDNAHHSRRQGASRSQSSRYHGHTPMTSRPGHTSCGPGVKFSRWHAPSIPKR